MRHIRFLQLGNENNTVLGNLALILSRVQRAFKFIFEDDVVDISSVTPQADGRYTTRDLDTVGVQYMRSRGYNEFAIAVTALPLEDMLASSADPVIALLSTHDWPTFSKFPVIKGLEYLVAGVLLDMRELSVVHYDTRGCPNDYCDQRSDIDKGIQKAELCHSCSTALLGALEKGDLTLQEAIAVFRILDDVADRRICFVLMPFRDEFGAAFEAICDAIKPTGFTARRADQIFQARSIVQIIYEQIGRAEIILADLTSRNPNVFYELGYAHALGKSTILITQKADDVPFDLKHRQYVLYNPSNLTESLAAKIRAYFP